ncbi:hypothetical protein GCM10028777_10190 [Angustibacter speluncae]
MAPTADQDTHDRREAALARLREAETHPDGLAGVPMVLALVDERGGSPRPVRIDDAQSLRDGARTAEEMDRLHDLLAPSRELLDARTTHVLQAEASLATFAPGGADETHPAPRGTRAVDVQRTALRAGSMLRVLNFHLTPDVSRDRLRADLSTLAERFDTTDLAGLDAFFESGRWPTRRPPVLPVFYEGYAASASVAAQVCDELGLTGWFAVCTGFVESPVDEQELYARAHWIDLHPSELDGRRLALTYDELGELARRHVVFPHTASHAGIADVTTDDDVRAELAEPLARVREATGTDAALHAWFLGTAYGASARHDEALRAAGYRYVVSNTMVQRIA